MYLTADRHAASDARLAALRQKPAAGGIKPHQKRPKQRNSAGDGVAVKAFGVDCFASRRALRLIAGIELDELDPIDKGMAKPVREGAQGMAVAGSRHAFVHFRKQHHIGSLAGQRGGDRITMAETLDIPGRFSTARARHSRTVTYLL